MDKYFDEADPGPDWADFADWLDTNLADAAETNFAWLVERFDWIVRRVTRDLVSYRDEVLPRSVLRVDDRLLDEARELDKPRFERFTVSQKVFVGLRGSYGGVLMFGLATSLAGWPLINAVSLGAGALFAAKSIYDESGAQLRRRQAVAKSAAQRHIDDFFLSFGKDTRDIVRQLHRGLRDHLTATAEELRMEILQEAQSARHEAELDAAERQRRTAAASGAIERLTALHSQIVALAPNGLALPGPRRRSRAG
jgi:hypothetical protein